METNIKINEANELINQLLGEVKKVVIGQDQLINSLIIALITKNHILLEGVPGLAKTHTINTFSKAINLGFNRVQFTPDLLPGDLIGTEIYDFKTGSFNTIKGPIFTNCLLADEINRAPSKVQSALLEAMAENQVTIGGETFKLSQPFIVLATQNPIEQSGTYSLPEAQLDRFLMKINISYIDKDSEIEMYKLKSGLDKVEINKILDLEKINFLQEVSEEIYISNKIYDYVYSIVDATRNPEKYGLEEIKKYIEYGVGPRGGIGLLSASKVLALMNNREFVIPEDIMQLVGNILGHRIVLSFEAVGDNVDANYILDKIISKVKIV